MDISKQLLYESCERFLNEAGTNIVGSMVIDNTEKLEAMLAKHQPLKGWFAHIGYVNDVTMLKGNSNRRDGNEEFGRSLKDKRIDDYLDSDDYKRTGEVELDSKGKPKKTLHAAKNPMDACLFCFYDVRIQWNLKGYEDKRNQENMIIDKYVSKPNRAERLLYTQDFRKRLEGYAGDKKIDPVELLDELKADAQSGNLDTQLVATIMKYIKKSDSNKGGGWVYDAYTGISQHSGTQNKALKIYTPYLLNSNSLKPHYFLSREGNIEEVSPDFVKFWKNEFASKLQTQPDSGLMQIINREVQFDERLYLLDKIAFVTYTYKDENGENVKFTYVNKNLAIPNQPNLTKLFVDMASSKIKESVKSSKKIHMSEAKFNELLGI